MASGLGALALAVVASAQVLYDASLGTLPSAQDWSYAAVPGAAQQSHTGAATRLVTTAALLENAGYARTIAPPLERIPGFHLALRLHLTAEVHTRANRAGFSLIALGADRRGIELGFWTNLVFAQNDAPLFTHGEDAAFDFAGGFTDLLLSLRDEAYTLFAAGTPISPGRCGITPRSAAFRMCMRRPTSCSWATTRRRRLRRSNWPGWGWSGLRDCVLPRRA